MPRIIQTRTRLAFPETAAASPATSVFAPERPFDPRPVPVNDLGSGQATDSSGGIFGLGADALGGGLEESADSVSSFFGLGGLFSNIADWGTELGRTLRLVSAVVMQVITPSFWIRVALFNTGLVAILLGVIMFARG